MINNNPAIALIAAILIMILSGFQLLSAGPVEVLSDYVQAIRDSDPDKAKSYWLSSEIVRSERLGITIAGITAKYDCASPLIYADGNNSKITGEKKIEIAHIDSLTAKATISLVYGNRDSVTIPYYVAKVEQKWRLCSSMYALARNWPKRPTRYFNVHCTNPNLINNYALNKLDSFVDSLGRLLDVSDSRMEFLAQTKIDYYLCDEKQIELLTGHVANGMTNLQFDAIITRHLPHTHELVHLLYNYAVEDLPLFTIPVLQEGLACCLGGRWGKSPEVINYWGNVSLTLELAKLDDILTIDGFYQCPGGIDAAYAISSLFVESLIDRFGMDRFMIYYHELSGNSRDINQFSIDDLKLKAETIFETSWTEIVNSLIETTSKYKYCGIIPGQPAILKDTSLELKSENLEIEIWSLDDVYHFQIKLSPECSGGALILADNLEVADTLYQSRFFKEQFSGNEYEGEVYGIRFSQGEVGLYDYNTNILEAKYVYGFTPIDGYWNARTGTIEFSLDQMLIDSAIGDYQIKLITWD
ncbi:MAG: hypothetical protein GY839_12880 [candidate division Zixibacteria bacterium]|nr:hypothetical protein [candidate division Zixibacteria bacterium]